MNDAESERIRIAYARREALGLDARYDYWKPENLFIYQARERAVLGLLSKAELLPLAGRRILDIGCGDGSVLADMLHYGANFTDLHGIDLLEDRVERARNRLPGATIEIGDARALPFDPVSLDVVLGFTLLSSVVDKEIRREIVAEMMRVTRPGGFILLYDFWTNPLNQDVLPLRRRDVRRLFSGKRIDFRSTTLAPPLVRSLFALPGGRVACTLLDMLPLLRTHFVAAVHM